jgi:alkylhydroperoxidase family enzyme
MPVIAPRPIESLRPDQRAIIEDLVARNKVSTPKGILTNAHSERLLEQALAAPQMFPYMGYDRIFGADLCELMRLRSAQLGGCEGCQKARYTENSEALVCAIDMPQGLGRREQLALRLMTLMHTDHHAIGRDFFAELAEVFTTAEIVELGSMIAGMVGTHRWLHALDLMSDEPPVCGMAQAAAQA